jgi:hypothetical protein
MPSTVLREMFGSENSGPGDFGEFRPLKCHVSARFRRAHRLPRDVYSLNVLYLCTFSRLLLIHRGLLQRTHLRPLCNCVCLQAGYSGAQKASLWEECKNVDTSRS